MTRTMTGDPLRQVFARLAQMTRQEQAEGARALEELVGSERQMRRDVEEFTRAAIATIPEPEKVERNGEN